MSEQEFIQICVDLHDSLIKNNENETKDEINSPLLNISLDVARIIESHGQIDTENESIKELYKTVFNVAANIKNHSYQVSHFKGLIRKHLENGNDNELLEACSMFSISQKFLLNSYSKAIDLTEKVLNLGKTK